MNKVGTLTRNQKYRKELAENTDRKEKKHKTETK